MMIHIISLGTTDTNEQLPALIHFKDICICLSDNKSIMLAFEVISLCGRVGFIPSDRFSQHKQREPTMIHSFTCTVYAFINCV